MDAAGAAPVPLLLACCFALLLPLAVEGRVITPKGLYAKGESTCAVLEDLSTKCWGCGMDGQLGYGNANNIGDEAGEMGDSLPRVDLGTGMRATKIAGGAYHRCALLATGAVKCWGKNEKGQLGYEDTVNRGMAAGEMGDALPVVNLGAGAVATALDVGEEHTCAVLSGGVLKCWGGSLDGQLGYESTANVGGLPGEMGDNLPPVNLGTGLVVKDVITGLQYTCAVLDNGGVKCFGQNFLGQLGLGDIVSRGGMAGDMGDALPFVDLGTGRTVVSMAAGWFHSCAILDDTSLKCWGYGRSGRLGQGNQNQIGNMAGQMGDALPPIDLGTGRYAIRVTTAGFSTCAVLDNGDVKCWGQGLGGVLGYGDSDHRGDKEGEMGDALPAVDLGPGHGGAVMISSGDSHTCVVLADGLTKCWGKNQVGQLGLETKSGMGGKPETIGANLPSLELGTAPTSTSTTQTTVVAATTTAAKVAATTTVGVATTTTVVTPAPVPAMTTPAIPATTTTRAVATPGVAATTTTKATAPVVVVATTAATPVVAATTTTLAATMPAVVVTTTTLAATVPAVVVTTTAAPAATVPAIAATTTTVVVATMPAVAAATTTTLAAATPAVAPNPVAAPTTVAAVMPGTTTTAAAAAAATTPPAVLTPMVGATTTTMAASSPAAGTTSKVAVTTAVAMATMAGTVPVVAPATTTTLATTAAAAAAVTTTTAAVTTTAVATAAVPVAVPTSAASLPATDPPKTTTTVAATMAPTPAPTQPPVATVAPTMAPVPVTTTTLATTAALAATTTTLAPTTAAVVAATTTTVAVAATTTPAPKAATTTIVPSTTTLPAAPPAAVTAAPPGTTTTLIGTTTTLAAVPAVPAATTTLLPSTTTSTAPSTVTGTTTMRATTMAPVAATTMAPVATTTMATTSTTMPAATSMAAATTSTMPAMVATSTTAAMVATTPPVVPTSTQPASTATTTVATRADSTTVALAPATSTTATTATTVAATTGPPSPSSGSTTVPPAPLSPAATTAMVQSASTLTTAPATTTTITTLTGTTVPATLPATTTATTASTSSSTSSLAPTMTTTSATTAAVATATTATVTAAPTSTSLSSNASTVTTSSSGANDLLAGLSFNFSISALPPAPVIVAMVAPGGAAARSGVSVGDTLLSLDGVDASSMTADDLMSSLSRGPSNLTFIRVSNPVASDSQPGFSMLGFTTDGSPPGPVTVAALQPGAWADNANVLPGDVLVSINGRNLTSIPGDFRELLHRSRPIAVTFSRTMTLARGAPVPAPPSAKSSWNLYTGRSYLGFTVDNLPPNPVRLRPPPSAAPGTGRRMQAADPGWAYSCGVQPGAELTMVNGQPVSSMAPTDFVRTLQTKRPINLIFPQSWPTAGPTWPMRLPRMRSSPSLSAACHLSPCGWRPSRPGSGRTRPAWWWATSWLPSTGATCLSSATMSCSESRPLSLAFAPRLGVAAPHRSLWAQAVDKPIFTATALKSYPRLGLLIANWPSGQSRPSSSTAKRRRPPKSTAYPWKESWAGRAGMTVGDELQSINGIPVVGMALEDLIQMLQQTLSGSDKPVYLATAPNDTSLGLSLDNVPPSRVRVTGADAGTRASRVGVAAGDELLTINGQNDSTIPPEQFVWMLRNSRPLDFVFKGSTVGVQPGGDDNLGVDISTCVAKTAQANDKDLGLYLSVKAQLAGVEATDQLVAIGGWAVSVMETKDMIRRLRKRRPVNITFSSREPGTVATTDSCNGYSARPGPR